jgi:dolichyl-phosphooligosaccharide-protein glycotransferase
MENKIKTFWKKYHITIIILLLIPLFLTGFFRAYTYSLPITDDWAEQTIHSNLKSNIKSQLMESHPNLDQTTLDSLVERNLKTYLKENDISGEIQSTSQMIKNNFQNEGGQTYMLAIDPYHYLRHAENIIDHGNVGDETIDGELKDNHMLAPLGRKTTNSLHPFLIAANYKILNLFGTVSVLQAAFILPLLISMLAIIPIFFLTKRLAGKLGAFIAAMALALSTSFLGRTPAGFSDTDAYNIFFPLTAIWLFVESIAAKTKKKRIGYATLSGLAIGLFSFAWQGWWYIHNVILASIVIYIAYLFYKQRKETYQKNKNYFQSSITYLISSTLFVTIFSGITQLKTIIAGPLSILTLKNIANTHLWPNVFTTVAELNSISFNQLIDAVGGRIIFFLGFFGIFLLMMAKKAHKERRLKYAILIGTWLLVTLFSVTKGTRFTLFLIAPIFIGLGIATSFIVKVSKKFLQKGLGMDKKLVTGILISLLLFAAIPMISNAHNVAKHEIPSMDDAWYNTLTGIKENTDEDTIISSWWDFGHWFKHTADRAVTFDGASQNTPQAHWIGKALLTSNEEESIGILRMLDCDGNNAYDKIFEETNDSLTSVNILYEIFTESESEAENTLNNYNLDADNILESTHCNPRNAILITSEDMVSKAGVWGHFGSWNFTKSYIYNNIQDKSRTESLEVITSIGITQEDANKIYNEINGLDSLEANKWISGFPSYQSSAKCGQQEGKIVCMNGVVIDPSTNQASLIQQGKMIPLKYYVTESSTYVNEFGYDFAVIYNNGESILADPLLRDSIFTRLFFFNGKNLDNFELFSHEKGLNNFDIYSWKVKW